MRYQTYNKKPTKHQKKIRAIEKAVLIFTILLFSVGNAIYTRAVENKVVVVIEEVVEQSIYDLEIVAVPIITSEPDIELQIRAIADEMDFNWPDYLVKLAYCESRLDHKALNTQGNTPADSYDRGLFQYNSYWQKKVSDECAYDIRCSTLKTIEMINNGQQHLWACDRIINNK